MPISLKSALGGGAVPINSFVDLYSDSDVMTIEGSTYFRVGYLDSNVSLYPDAIRRKWYKPIASTTGSGSQLQNSAVISNMEYRFGRWILAGYGGSEPDRFSIVSTSSFSFSPNVLFSQNYTELLPTAVGYLNVAPKFVWSSTNSTLYCYINNSGKRYQTTEGTTWSSSSLVGLSGKYILDAILFGSVWLVIANDGIYSSTDGLTFTLRQAVSIPNSTRANLATNGTTVVAAVSSQTYYTSTNGTTWASNTAPNGLAANYVQFGDSKWYFVLRDGSVLYPATTTNLSTFNVSQVKQTNIYARWSTLLSQWVSESFPMALSKDGLSWLYLSGQVDSIGVSAVSGMQGWIEQAGTFYGVVPASGAYYAASTQPTAESVGIVTLPVGMTNNSNTFIRVN